MAVTTARQHEKDERSVGITSCPEYPERFPVHQRVSMKHRVYQNTYGRTLSRGKLCAIDMLTIVRNRRRRSALAVVNW